MTSRCPFFSSRVDYQGKHLIICIDRVHGITDTLHAPTAWGRDALYVVRCCGNYQSCAVRKDIRMRLIVKHPGLPATYDIYGKLLKDSLMLRAEVAEGT